MDLKLLQETPPWEWPKRTSKLLHATLTDPMSDEAERLIAAELAGDLCAMDDQLAEDLMAIVRDNSLPEELRAKAAISFGPVLEQCDTDGFDDADDSPIAESTFEKIKGVLHQVYFDGGNPKLLRRRALEASVRALEPWHKDAVLQAYAGGDPEWMLTAVFAMTFIKGFDKQILESLNSNDEMIHYYAIQAAGTWSLDTAWDHVVALLEDPDTPKDLQLAAIGAVGEIRPSKAGPILVDLVDSDDEEIAEAASEALMLAETMSDMDDFEEEDEEED
jgi:hypothetical protein